MKSMYPETNINQKHFIFYTWDSIWYDFIHKEQMKVLDSMAANYGKYKFEYVFVTEMGKTASESFLKRNYDAYKNVKMLYEMDDYISGIHNLKNIKLNPPKHVSLSPVKEKNKNKEAEIYKIKQTSLYLIMDAKGTVLQTNGNKCIVLMDTAFLNKLKTLMPDKNFKILN